MRLSGNGNNKRMKWIRFGMSLFWLSGLLNCVHADVHLVISLTRAALSTGGRAKANQYQYETRQLVSLLLFSFLWAWQRTDRRLKAVGCRWVS